MRTKIVSSLEKCFIDSNIDNFTELSEEKIFKNQRFSFQVAIDSKKISGDYGKLEIIPVVESEINEYITVREVVNIPCEMPAFHTYDEGVDKVTPGLFPDLLRKIKYNGTLRIPPEQTRAMMLTVDPDNKISGEFEIKIKFHKAVYDKGLKATDEILAENTFKLHIADASLPEQTVKITQWFYADCLADYYGVEMFSDRHFEICESFIKTAVKGGRNMLLLPVLTYSLDIYHGGERPTTQLIDVYKNGSEYTFGYEKLDKWLDMCNRAGVKYHEVSHFFSQWGTDSTPKVVAYVDGKKKNIFSWNTDPLSPEYTEFLRAFLKGFIEHMKERNEDNKLWFHISDEPQHEEQYLKVKNTVADILEGYPIMDAVSSYSYAEKKIISNPVPKTAYIEPFLENNVENLMCYYSGGQWDGVSNCLFSMPLSRTRFLGTQLFKYNVKGFLNWGYNFYNNRFSYDRIDPFLAPDSEGFVPGGSGSMVYPAPDGTAQESARFVAFYEAIEDTRAMELCEKLYSHDETVKAIEEIAGEIKFSKCVYKTDEMMAIRRKINEMIFKKLNV